MAILAQLVDDVVVHKFELHSGLLSLGRHPDNDITINESAVSGQHAIIRCEQNQDFPDYLEFFIEDKDSTNGTFVNDLPVKGRVRLHHNDEIRLAWNRFQFIDPNDIELGKTVHIAG